MVRKRSYTYQLILTLVTLFQTTAAHAVVLFEMSSMSLLQQAAGTPPVTTSLRISSSVEKEGPWLFGRAHLIATGFVHSPDSLTVEAKDLYVASSNNLIHRHQLSLGRRSVEWSVADEHWNLGTWSPRFTWSPLNPESVGMTGAFYHYKSPTWQITAFASPVSVPERGAPQTESDGKIVSASPEWVAPFEQLSLMNQRVPIQYSLKFPDLKELIFSPGAAIMARFAPREGVWFSASYGYLTANTAELAVEAKLKMQPMLLQTTLHPYRLQHHLLTTEAGFRGELFSHWASFSLEDPIKPSLPAEWMTSAIGPTAVTALGSSMKTRRVEAEVSYMLVQEDKAPLPPGQLPLDLPSRYFFNEAFRVKTSLNLTGKATVSMRYTQDLRSYADWTQLDISYSPKREWNLSLGGDVFSGSQSGGNLVNYKDHDRLRARVVYEF